MPEQDKKETKVSTIIERDSRTGKWTGKKTTGRWVVKKKAKAKAKAKKKI